MASQDRHIVRKVCAVLLRFAACLRANRHVLAVGTMLGIEVEDDGIEVFGDLLGYAGHSLYFLETCLAHALDATEVLEELLAPFGTQAGNIVEDGGNHALVT